MNDSQDVPRRSSRKKGKRNKQRDDIPLTGRKVSRDGHGKQKREGKEETLAKEIEIRDLPLPNPIQLAALTKLLKSVLTKYGLSEDDIAERRMILQDIKHLLNQEIPDCTVRWYGSSYSCLGLKGSDVNIDVREDNEDKIPQIFITLLNLLKSSVKYSDVKDGFEMTKPTINFRDINSGLRCRVSTGNNSSVLTTTLLKIYGEMDSRVKPLCVALKLWAKICKVDCPAAGTLPSYSFVLMVVHFLQQSNPPVLPVIHEKLSDLNMTKCIEKQNSSEDILAKIRAKWSTTNTESLGSLWLGLLRYYSACEKFEKIIINVREEKKCLRSTRGWGKKKLAIEDPFSTKRNVARTLLSGSSYRFIVEHLKLALLYFGRIPGSVSSSSQPAENGSKNNHPETLEKSLEGRQPESERTVDTTILEESEEEKGKDDDEEEELLAGSYADDDDDEVQLIDGIFAEDTINDSALDDIADCDIDDEGNTSVTDQSLVSETCLSEMINGDLESSPIETETQNNDKTAEGCHMKSVILPDLGDLELEGVQYVFDDSVLTRGHFLDAKCSSCGEDGHVVDNCTIEKKPELKNLPKLTDWFRRTLDHVCLCCAGDFAMTQDEVSKRQLYMRALEAFVRSHYSDARLHMFGSSCNGFGFRGSDLDICMTFEGKKKNDIDCIKTINSLAKILRGNHEVNNVIAITGAKVPIVKFFLKRANLEADISLYNEVALWNTKLLATYVQIDKRVHILGCTLKVFVKVCDIGDASRGSLSSYAYILMLLHFLQQRQPPVIPVLQELYDTDKQPQRMVEGFNCWFYDDLKILGSKWTARNTESCGELWLEFLRYYTETFDYQRHVVCVRFLKPLTKFEKMWNGRKICIEDPFVLTHNLGAGLSANMVKFIFSTFEKARERFGTPRRDIPEHVPLRQMFFFDIMFLNGGHLPPTGRNCNICGKIGHWAKECPYNKANRGQEGKNRSKKNQKEMKKVEQNKQEDEQSTSGDHKQIARNENVLKSDPSAALLQKNDDTTLPSSLSSEKMPKVTVDPQRTTIPSSGQLLQLNQTPVPVPQANSSSLHWRQQASPSPLEPGLIDRFRFVSTARPLAPSVPQSPRLPVGMVVRTRFPGSPPNFDQRAAVPNYISNLYPNPALAPRNTFVRHSSPFGQQLNSSPRQQPAVSNIQPVTPRGRYAELIPIPISTNDFVNKSLNLISGDVLENQGNFKPALDRDQADGTCRTLHDHQLPPNSVDRRTNDGFSASLAETLNSMRISGDIVIEDRHFERVPDSTESHVTRHSTQHQEASGVSDGELQHTIKERRNGKDILEHFSTPPNVQNIADKSMTFEELAALVKANSSNGLATPLANTNQNVKPGNDIPETLKQPHDGDLCREGKRDDKPVTKKEVSSPILPNSATEGENLKTPNPMSSASRRRRNRKKNKQLKGGNMDDASDSLSVKQSDTEPAGTAHQRTVKREVSKKHGPPEKNSSLPNKREQAKGGKVKEKNDEKSNDSSLPDKSRLVKGGKMKKKNEKTSNHSSLPDKNGQAKGSKVKEKNDERSNHSSLPNKSGLVKEMKEKNEETSNHSLLPDESGQAKVGKAKEKKEETSNQTNAGNKTPKPRPFKISVKSEKLVVRVDKHDKREVEVDKRTGTNAQPNKRRRRRSGRKKKSIDSEGIERRDERPGNDSVARKSTRAKTPGGQTNTKSEVKK